MNAREQRMALQGLLASAGWRVFCNAIQEQNDQRTHDSVMQPMRSMEDLVAKESLNAGIRRGVELVSLPEALIQSLELEIERENAQEGMENGNEAA